MILGINSLVVFHLKNLPDILSKHLFFVQNLAPNWYQIRKKHLQFDFVQNPSFSDHFKIRSDNTKHTFINNEV